MRNQLKIFIAVISLTVAAVWQTSAACKYSITPASASLGSEAALGSFAMSVNSGCSWTAVSTNAWLHTSSSGDGSGAILFTVDSNTSPNPRTGYISAGGVTVSVAQAGAPATLPEALNATNLVWETSGDYPWNVAGPPSPNFDGQFSAASGNSFVQNSTSWLKTDLVGPGQLSFWWKVDSDVTPPENPWSYDYLEFLINGDSQSSIMGAEGWVYRSYDLPAGTNTVTWQYVKDAQYNLGSDRGWVDMVSYTTNAAPSLAEALNTSGVAWSTGGNDNPTVWQGETTVSHDGAMAAKSGAITINQESWVEATVSGVTNVSFWWSVSSEANSDWLELWTNGAMAMRISGEVAWQSNNVPLTAQTNTLRWRYVKDGLDYSSKGQDSGWLDQVQFSPSPTANPFVLSAPARLPGGDVQLFILGDWPRPCELQVSSNLLTWETLSNIVTTGPSTPFTDGQAAGQPTRYYRALSH